MAATPTEPNPNDVGTFVTNVAVGFVLATPAQTLAIQKQMKLGGASDMRRQFVDDLLAIKLLAPVESAELLVHPVPMIKRFVSQLRRDLVMSYYLQRSEQ